MQSLARDKLLRDLPFEFHTVNAMFCHGLHFRKPGKPGQFIRPICPPSGAHSRNTHDIGKRCRKITDLGTPVRRECWPYCRRLDYLLKSVPTWREGGNSVFSSLSGNFLRRKMNWNQRPRVTTPGDTRRIRRRLKASRFMPLASSLLLQWRPPLFSA
ncbi:hypothetical protein D9M72_538180 [compost metagenome]